MCTLEPKDKFILFVHDTVDPATFLNVAYSAGIGEAENNDPTFGQGAGGYGKRFSAGFAGQASSEFFKDFAYPTTFSEDPVIIAWLEGVGGSVCPTQQSTYSLRTGKMARICSISQNGSERRVLSR